MIKGIIEGLISGGLSFFKDKFNVDLEKYKVDGQVSQKALEVSLEVEKARIQQLIADNSTWMTRIIRPLFAGAVVFYIWAIVLDSAVWNSNSVQRLPEFVEEWFFVILTAYFGGRSVEKIVDSISKRFTR